MLDQSLDDIIKFNRQAQKSHRNVPVKSTGKFLAKTSKTGRITKSSSQFVKPEKPLFTKTYQLSSAPVKEIYTSRYIPQTTPIKLTVINTNASKPKLTSSLGSQAAKSIRLETTQKVTGSKPSPSALKPKASSPIISGSKGFRSTDPIRDNRRPPESKNHTPIKQNESRTGKFNDKKSNSNNSINNSAQHHTAQHTYNKSNKHNGSAARHNNNSDHSSEMELDDSTLSIRGMGQLTTDYVIKDDEGLVTIEIENLDPGTTAEDVKYVCSRFGEIKTCVCSNGYSQVTFARRAAGFAAVSALNGKKADNDQILRVSVKKNVVLHGGQVPLSHTPSSISGPMKLLSRAVEGTIKNAGTLYQEQLQVAEQMLKVQQQRMAHLHLEEQRIASLRMQATAQYGDLNGGWAEDSFPISSYMLR